MPRLLLAAIRSKVPQDQMFDLTDTGAFDMGKGRNVGLGRLREALGMNAPGEPFSMGAIRGRMAKVVVSHRPNGEDLYAEIRRLQSRTDFIYQSAREGAAPRATSFRSL